MWPTCIWISRLDFMLCSIRCRRDGVVSGRYYPSSATTVSISTTAFWKEESRCSSTDPNASAYKNQLLEQQAAKSKKWKKISPNPPSSKSSAKKLRSSPSVVDSAANGDTTPCLICEIPYCDSNVEWFLCKNCRSWVCGTCAGVGMKPKKKCKTVFVCFNCK